MAPMMSQGTGSSAPAERRMNTYKQVVPMLWEHTSSLCLLNIDRALGANEQVKWVISNVSQTLLK